MWGGGGLVTITAGWRKLHNDKPHNSLVNILLAVSYQDDCIRENEIDETCSTHEGDEKSVYIINFRGQHGNRRRR